MKNANDMDARELADELRRREAVLEEIRRWFETAERRFDLTQEAHARFIAAEAMGNLGAARNACSHLAWQIERLIGGRGEPC